MKTRYENFMKEYDFFRERIEELTNIKQELSNDSGYIKGVDFDTNDVTVNLYSPDNYGDRVGDSYYYEFTVDDLTCNFEDYKNKLLKEKEEKIEAEKKRKEEEKKKEKTEKEQRDKKEYERLKSKYEGGK